MKKIIGLMLVSMSIFILAACKFEGDMVYTYSHDDTEIHHFRTNAYNYDGTHQTDAVVIQSVAAMEHYIDENRSRFFVTEDVPNQPQSFYDFTLTLDQPFFETYQVVLIRVEESSGSIRHNVEEIRVENDILHVSIERIKPEIGTTDMAFWHIVLIIPIDEGTFENVEVEMLN